MNTNAKKNTTTNTNKNRNGRKENTMKTGEKKNIYEVIGQRIIEEMEKGTVPWRKPWFGAQTGAYSRVTGKPYSLLNQLLLGENGEYATMKRINEEGGRVKKGAHSTVITYWSKKTKKVTNENGEEEEKVWFVLKPHRVFNIKDTTLEPKKRKVEFHHEPCEMAEKIIDGYVKKSGIVFINDEPSNEAYYRPSTDTVTVPMMSQYENVEMYYSTVFHEFTHSTGHKSRLNRIDTKASFGTDVYSKEELVAELGAASLVNTCGLESEKSFKNSASYIENWLEALKAEPEMIGKAAIKADKAVAMIMDGIEEEEPKEVSKPKAKAKKTKKVEPKKGEFKKEKFYIKKAASYDVVDGYVTKVGKVKVGVDKRDKCWYTTELTTGLGLGGYGFNTRKEAVKWVEDNMDVINKAMKSERIKEAQNTLKELKKKMKSIA